MRFAEPPRKLVLTVSLRKPLGVSDVALHDAWLAAVESADQPAPLRPGEGTAVVV